MPPSQLTAESTQTDPIDKSLMIPGILHKRTLDSANLKQITSLIKNSPGMVGEDKCLNHLSDLIDAAVLL